MLVGTTLHSPVEAVLVVPPISVASSFDAVSTYVEHDLLEIGTPARVIYPAIELLEEPWGPDQEHGDRETIVESVLAMSDARATLETIDAKTKKRTCPIRGSLIKLFHDLGKYELLELTRKSEAGEEWTEEDQAAYDEHVRISKRKVEGSNLPDTLDGEPLRQFVADGVGETHSRQLGRQYGCGHNLGRKARRATDGTRTPDNLRARFYRENSRNKDANGKPLSDLVRSRLFAKSVTYQYGDYWPVDKDNNPWEIALAVYSRMRENHPRLVDPSLAFNIGYSAIELVA